jgi:hypothetical protein
VLDPPEDFEHHIARRRIEDFMAVLFVQALSSRAKAFLDFLAAVRNAYRRAIFANFRDGSETLDVSTF